jgi:uncharacterized protein
MCYPVRIFSPRSLPLAMVTALLALGVSVSPSSAASTKKSKNETADSAPVLMSRTAGAGGSTWGSVKELTAAAEKGNPKAQTALGEMLLRGDPQHDVKQDRARALKLLEEAARKGESSAAFRLGMLLDDGDGVPQDRARAMAYFRAAAAGGASEALHNIGAAYASGRGVKRDYAEGLAWLILAKKQGAESAGEAALRAHIQKLKRPEMVTAAEKRAAEIERELAGKSPVEFLPPPGPLGS